MFKTEYYEGSDEDGNLYGDPMYVSGPFGDFYLDPQSPCIDAGRRSAFDAGVSDRTTQSDGTPDTGVVDMGYHYPILADPVNVELECWLNGEEFSPGDLMQGNLKITNKGADVVLDVFVAFVLPNGSVLNFTDDGFYPGIWPWRIGWFMPSGYVFGPEMLFALTVPDGVPAGQYLYASAAGLSESSFEFISAAAQPFTVTGAPRVLE